MHQQTEKTLRAPWSPILEFRPFAPSFSARSNEVNARQYTKMAGNISAELLPV